MPIAVSQYRSVLTSLTGTHTTLVAVSKTKPVEDIRALYELGQRDFGENYVQELADKQAVLPADIRWHFIGHLQTNKVKYIAPFVHLIHGIDSLKLLREVNKQALKHNRVIQCLLQVHIAEEETKFGMDEHELHELIHELHQLDELHELEGVDIRGLMGMGSFSEDEQKVRSEFRALKLLFDKYKTAQEGRTPWSVLSMGMSGDYTIAIEEGSTMVRIGSLLFGTR